MLQHAPIFYLTDFGTFDPFVGIMKAVAIGAGHNGQHVELTHEVPPQDVLRGAVVLEDALPALPRGAAVCVVVDPGVGTARRAIIVESPSGVFCIGPDNGVLSPVIKEDGARVRAIDPGGPINPGASATFHGRDVFAPAAALIASGQKRFEDFGAEVSVPVLLEFPKVSAQGGKLTLQIVSHDHFGNLATNLRRDEIPPETDFEAGSFFISGRQLGPMRKTFGDVAKGQPLVYFNSFGRLEVAINGGNARDYYFAKAGTKVEFLPEKKA